MAAQLIMISDFEAIENRHDRGQLWWQDPDWALLATAASLLRTWYELKVGFR
jgi:hypothetical protein